MIHLTQHNRLHASLPAGLPASLPASLPACPRAPALHHVILKTWTFVFSRLSRAVVLVRQLSLYQPFRIRFDNLSALVTFLTH